MSYAEECYEALDEEITGMIKRLKSLYAGGERYKEEEKCTERQR